MIACNTCLILMGVFSLKCYRMQPEPLSFAAAEAVCHSSLGVGSADAHLVQIRDRDELKSVQRLCRDQS